MKHISEPNIPNISAFATDISTFISDGIVRQFFRRQSLSFLE
jgi:hypothetical protein